MKYLKIVIMSFLLIVLLANCKLIDGWTQFEVKYSSTVTLPQDLDINKSSDVYPSEIEANLKAKVENEGSNYKIISSTFKSTMDELIQLGAENIQETRMSVDEIAVQILKNNK